MPQSSPRTTLTTCSTCRAALAPGHVICAACGTPVPGEEPPTMAIDEFTPDCANCHGLCCVALAFNWPHYSKPAGTPCKHLTADFTCGKWDSLEEDGYFACKGFDCLGAGPATARGVERACGGNWRDTPAIAEFELGNFQKVYAAVFEHVTGAPPPEDGNGD